MFKENRLIFQNSPSQNSQFDGDKLRLGSVLRQNEMIILTENKASK